MTTTPLPVELSLPTWRRLPVSRRQRLAVLVGQLAWRRLNPEQPATASPGEEDVHGHRPADGQDQRASP